MGKLLVVAVAIANLSLGCASARDSEANAVVREDRSKIVFDHSPSTWPPSVDYTMARSIAEDFVRRRDTRPAPHYGVQASYDGKEWCFLFWPQYWSNGQLIETSSVRTVYVDQFGRPWPEWAAERPATCPASPGDL